MKGIPIIIALIATILLALLVVSKGIDQTRQQPQEEISVAKGSKNPSSSSNDRSAVTQDNPISNPRDPEVDYDDVLTDVDPSLIPDVDFYAMLERKPYRRYRVVEVNTNILRERIRNAEFRETFTVKLFDEPITLITERGSEYTEGWQAGLATWEGKISDREWSYCTIVIDPNGLVRATFQAEDIGFVTIEALGESGHHLMWSMDDSKIVDKGIDTSFIDRGDDSS